MSGRSGQAARRELHSHLSMLDVDELQGQLKENKQEWDKENLHGKGSHSCS